MGGGGGGGGSPSLFIVMSRVHAFEWSRVGLVLSQGVILAHQSPYRTGMLFLPILPKVACQNVPYMVENGFQFWHKNIPHVRQVY